MRDIEIAPHAECEQDTENADKKGSSSEAAKLSDFQNSDVGILREKLRNGVQSGGVGVLKGEKKEKEVSKKGRKGKKSDAREKLAPLKVAAENIADMLSSLSEDRELFVVSQDEKPQRRLDTKTLKEFSSVIKEITGVICELNGISSGKDSEGTGAVKIEFDEDAEACSQ